MFLHHCDICYDSNVWCMKWKKKYISQSCFVVLPTDLIIWYGEMAWHTGADRRKWIGSCVSSQADIHLHIHIYERVWVWGQKSSRLTMEKIGDVGDGQNVNVPIGAANDAHTYYTSMNWLAFSSVGFFFDLSVVTVIVCCSSSYCLLITRLHSEWIHTLELFLNSVFLWTSIPESGKKMYNLL